MYESRTYAVVIKTLNRALPPAPSNTAIVSIKDTSPGKGMWAEC